MNHRPTYDDLEKQIHALRIENDELRKAHGAIQASQALHRITLESISDTVIITDDYGKIIYTCPNTDKIFGLSQKQVYELGTIQALIGGNACDLSELRKLQEIPNIEWTVFDQSGRTRFMLITVKLVYIEEGTILYCMRDITPEKKTEEALRKSKEKWRNILVNIPQIGVSLDPQARIVFANKHLLDLTGWQEEEIIGKNWFDFFVPENIREEVRNVFDTIMDHKDNCEFSTSENEEILTRTGELRKVAWFRVLTKDAQGNIADATSLGIDLTERKAAENELLRQKKLFETMFNTISDGVVITNTRREILLANKGMESTFGYKPEELLGKSAEMLYADKEKYNEAGVMVFGEHAKRPGDLFVTYYRDKNGRQFPGETFGAKLFDENNKWIGNLGISRDITDRKQAEAALRESEKKYRSMMEAFADPLYICSPDFTVEYMNPAMIRHTGRDATGEKCHSALHGLDSKCDWCSYDKVLLGDKFETNIKSPLDGRDYRITHMPIQNRNGTFSKMTIFRDITDYLRAVSEKEKAQAQLMQAQKMESIGILAGGIAHDFNNILASIIGFTELALDDVRKGTTLEDSLQEVHSAAKRAKELVKQILAFARQSDEKRSPIQPRIIIEEVLKFIRSTIPTTITIRQNMESNSLIMGNPTQVHQVLMNLCANAAHAMEDSGGVLQVSLKDAVIDMEDSLNINGLPQGDYVEVAVSDTGVGIAPDIVGSIFDPYFTTKGSGEGTGMGLAMVHGIVESYGGKITVDSRLGKGTTFAIYLPVIEKQSTLEAYVPEPLMAGKERILFVDDELTISKMGSKVLKRLGYSVTSCTSSIEALELFLSKPGAFDLVITDMTMPNLTGDKLAMELMKIRPDIPIILCTGYSKQISEETASEIGIRAFVYKPIVRADLAKIIRKVLDDAG
jgi:PAS domain S-box-containing protein